ncbi:MAG: alpha/beta hydrolase [Bdellovibrionaceae bacterium]|nr:alpha/beta hydrolase [Pseudobdellovibrionaceae bacterium]
MDDQTKGSILLIHGSAPFNRDGRVPDTRAGRYATTAFFEDIRKELESRGWHVVTYSKPGVFEDRVDYNTYKTTDLKVLGGQIRQVWKTLPESYPKLVFAWSEGSLHVSQLPLGELGGVVIAGGIATGIRDVVLWQGRDQKTKVEAELRQIKKLPRDEMLGLDRPAGRLIDELEMAENWKAFSEFKNLPMLILHGTADTEVPVSQAQEWSKKLSHHPVSVRIVPGKNHMLGDGDLSGGSTVAQEIDAWWTGSARKGPR